MTLEMRGLVTGYAHARVLHGIDIDVGVGEAVSVLGPNGSGKTTLLRAIAGALPAWEGKIVFYGREVQRAKPWHRARAGLAHVPDGRGLFAPMTVWENLWVAAGDADRARSRLDDTWELFPELRPKLGQAAGSLSGGEQQMLAVARALIASPKLVLIDELSAGLAPIVAERLVSSLRRARDETGVSVLLVEQNPHIVRDFVDRVYVLEQGRAVASGSMEDVGGIAAIAEMYLGAEGAKPRRRAGKKRVRTRKENVK